MANVRTKQAQEPLLQPRSYWRWSKRDFFPEPSFESFSSYRAAVSNTCSRLKDRLLHRTTETTELVHLRRESGHDMNRCLTWWDLIWLSFGAVVGTSVFTITGQEAHDHAGPAIVLSYAISGFSAMLSVFCYTEFAVEIPIAGGSFSYLRIELGDFIAFTAAGNLILEAIIGTAAVGRSWSSYFASLLTNDTDYLRIRVNFLPKGFDLLDPVAFFVIVLTNAIAISGTKRTSVLNWIGCILSLMVIVFIIVMGIVCGDVSNLNPYFPNGEKGVFEAAAIVYMSYVGFDMVATMAEETKQPSRDIPIGLVGSMSMITVIYCLMGLSLTMLQKYTEIDRNAAFSIAFGKIGMNWAKYLVGICALKGMTSSLLVMSLGQARYITQIARAHMIPPWFALVHPKSGTPIYATLLITITGSVITFFTSLHVLSSVFSISTLSIFMLIAIALLVRRYYIREVTEKEDLIKFITFLSLVIGSSIGFTILWNMNRRGWIEYSVAALIWSVGNLGMTLLPKQRVPKVWGVPMVPWLPSLSIVVNLFLIGSLGMVAFFRFFVCTALMLLYYFFVGLHATYDVACSINSCE
ncbi:cationic amino acid transporter 8, vacuolar-like [Cannabis sativa]|uniref:cationic amino acid transporter 8, vacuolar-like n=1 Tax=Cannabis sativa TaxID=3483 RepID=UPI0029CA9802|nr:cationic amino acid transporter 8, vacuolar-like [Cannabis sativa]